MVHISRAGGLIECRGHAASEVGCAMLTALTDSLLENIGERLGEHLAGEPESGHFAIMRDGLSEKAADLFDAYWYSLTQLAKCRPLDFKIDSITPGGGCDKAEP